MKGLILPPISLVLIFLFYKAGFSPYRFGWNIGYIELLGIFFLLIIIYVLIIFPCFNANLCSKTSSLAITTKHLLMLNLFYPWSSFSVFGCPSKILYIFLFIIIIFLTSLQWADAPCIPLMWDNKHPCSRDFTIL